MASISETGIANNVSNFEVLTTSITGFGTSYNPSKNSIKLPALQALLNTSKEALNTVNIAQSAESNATAAREVAFNPLGKLITRVNNAIKASDTTAQVDENVLTIVRKLQGRRASAKLTDEEKNTLATQGIDTNQISSTQMSFDNRIENLDKLVMLLDSIPEYAPNEEDLKVESLKTLQAELKTKNNEAITASIQLDNTRISRNEILNTPLTGLVDVALDAKTYIKSVYGATSPQYKQVSKLRFIARK